MQTTHDLTTVDVPIDSVTEHPANARRGDVEIIEESLNLLGQYVPIVVQRSTGYIIKGNHTHRAARRRGFPTIKAIMLDVDDEQAQRVMLMDNAASDRGEYDMAQLIRNLQDIQANTDLGLLGTGYDEDALMNMLADSMQPEAEDEVRKARSAFSDLRAKYRAQRLDVIVACGLASRWILALAIDAGAKPGTASNSVTESSISRYYNTVRHQDLVFVDNKFAAYDHAEHINGLRLILEAQQGRKVKYATVRDVMTRQQCADAGCEYYPLEQVLEHAEEVEAYADNVIVIPKYPCMDQIPEKYMLGYSVLTSYGMTPVPIQAFAGRRLHLLGGSLRMQAGYLLQMGDDVISCDANMSLKLAQRGLLYHNDGGVRPVSSLGFELSNGYMTSYVISMGVFMAAMYHVSTGTGGKTPFLLEDDGIGGLGFTTEHGMFTHELGGDIDEALN
jgi:ParB-like chromosome segregation protein Spo0J